MDDNQWELLMKKRDDKIDHLNKIISDLQTRLVHYSLKELEEAKKNTQNLKCD